MKTMDIMVMTNLIVTVPRAININSVLQAIVDYDLRLDYMAFSMKSTDYIEIQVTGEDFAIALFEEDVNECENNMDEL